MKPPLLAIAAAALAGAVSPSRPHVDLSWLAGSWATEEHGRWTEEQWSKVRFHTMIGFSRSGDASTLKEFEFLRIVPDETGTLVYWASPEGRPPVSFRLARADATSAEFENQRHDYPQRIAYRREGETLIATISAIDGSRPVQWRYRRRE